MTGSETKREGLLDEGTHMNVLELVGTGATAAMMRIENSRIVQVNL